MVDYKGTPGADVFNGTSGADTIHGGYGDDRLNGGGGNDRYIYKDGDALRSSRESVSDSSGTDIIAAHGSNDFTSMSISGIEKLELHGGGTTILTGQQYEAFSGGVHFMSGAHHLIVEVTGGDAVMSPKVINRGPEDSITVKGDDVGHNGHFRGVHGLYNDYINGSDTGDTIVGGRGNDSLAGYGGDDIMYPGLGADSVSLGGGDDMMIYGYDPGEFGDYNRLNVLTDEDTFSFGTEVTGTGFVKTVSRGSMSSEHGFAVITDNINISSDHSVASALSGFSVPANFTAMLMVGNASQSAFYRLTNDASPGISAADLVRVATLIDANQAQRSGMAQHNVKLPIMGTDGDNTLSGSNTVDFIYGYGGDDTIDGGGSFDFLFGGAGDDVIFGKTGEDLIEGGAGDDRIDGGYGADKLSGGAGKDTFVISYIEGDSKGDYGDVISDFDVQTDHDVLELNAPVSGDGFVSTTGTGRMAEGDGFAVITGAIDISSPAVVAAGLSGFTFQPNAIVMILVGDGADSAVYQVKNDADAAVEARELTLVAELQGFSAADRQAFTSANVKLPGALVKTPDESSAPDSETPGGVFRGDGQDNTLHGTAGDDILYGKAGDDTLHGRSGSDILAGGAGDDTLHGEDGDDHLSGGEGDDRLMGGAGSDRYVFLNGEAVAGSRDVIKDSLASKGEEPSENDVIESKGTNDFTGLDISGVEKLVLQKAGTTAVTDVQVEAFHNIVFAAGANVLKVIVTGMTFKMPKISGFSKKLDSITIEADSDSGVSVTGSMRNETVKGGGGEDVIHGRNGDDILEGGGGDDVINGGGGDDEITGGAGDDILNGGRGRDFISTGMGGDVVVISRGADMIYTGVGDDTLRFMNWSHTGNHVVFFDWFDNDKIAFNGLSLETKDVTHTGVKFHTETGDADISSRTESIFEFDSDLMTMAASISAESALTNAFAQIGKGQTNEVTTSAGARNVFILYDGGGPFANAGVFYFDDKNGDGKVDKNELSILAFLEESGADNLDARDFTFGRDPLVFDLDGDGVKLLDTGAGARFDMNADGARDAAGWFGPGDAMLVIDENSNGKIDGMGEVVSSYLTYGGGKAQGAAGSLDALAAFDDNGDGQINAADAIYSVLRLWNDKNSDGLTDEGELLSLKDYGIVSIGLEGTRVNDHQHGGTVMRLAEARMENGETMTVGEVSLESETAPAPDPEEPALGGSMV